VNRTTLPARIQVTHFADGVRYVIRRRHLSRSGLYNVQLLAVGLVFLGTATWLLPLAMNHGWGMIAILFILFGIVYVAFGLYCLLDLTVIEVNGKTLRARRGFGLFSWSGSRAVDCVRGLNVTLAQVVHQGGKIGRTGRYASLATLTAQCDRGQPLTLARSYPRDWLRSLAADLARRLSCVSGKMAALAVEVVEDRHEPVPFVERSEKPSQSKAVLVRQASGLALTLPPPGLWRGSSGCYFLFGLVWMMCVTVAGISFLPGAPDRGQAVLVLLICLVAGVVVLLIGIHLGSKQAVFTVAGASLMVVEDSGLLGSKCHEWTRREIADIRTGWAGPDMNADEKPLPELQILLGNGEIHGMLSGRGEQELQWIATVLRQALRVPHESG
jgi:hypothetical protein